LVFSVGHEIAVQQPVEDMDDPVVEHGMPLPIVDGYGLGVGTACTGLGAGTTSSGLGAGTTSSGLSPALPISTEPNGIPV
jgi:hypothetical protein